MPNSKRQIRNRLNIKHLYCQEEFYMKQSITKEQWNELSNDLQKIFCHYHNINLLDFNHQKNIESYLLEYVSIGQMIEFLGDDFNRLSKCEYGWHLGTDGHSVIDGKKITKCCNKELCDTLWEAVKYKLK